MRKEKINLNSILYGVTVLALLIDSFRSGTIMQHYFHISSQVIEVSVIIFLIISRILLKKQTLHPFLEKANTFIILPTAILLGGILTIGDSVLPPNYVYSMTMIQHPQLIYLAIFSAIVWLLHYPNDWFAKNYPRVVFFGSIACLAAAYAFSLFPHDIFKIISAEDNLIEYTQVIVLILAAFFSLQVAGKIFAKPKHKLHALAFLLAALGLFFVAGDEISWGQRIFNVATPENIAAVNKQKETTIHNLYVFVDFVGLAYILIGFYGATSWIIQSFVPRLRKAPFIYYIPPWFCVFYFLSGFLYNYYAALHLYSKLGVWSEPAELMLYAGIMFTVLSVLISVSKKKK